MGSGFDEFRWDNDGEVGPEELALRCIEEYELDQKDKGLNKVEFSYLVAELVSTYPVKKNC